ncbi:MAG: hypothetical protein AB1792_07060 [Candidatus Zixiibacteriota bacterium]
MKLRLIIIAALVLLFVGVGAMYLSGNLNIVNPVKPQVEEQIDEATFVRAYVELAILAETSPIGSPEYEEAKTRILGGLGVTPEEVEQQLASYNNRPDQWRPIWEKIQAELAKRSQTMSGEAATGRDSAH